MEQGFDIVSTSDFYKQVGDMIKKKRFRYYDEEAWMTKIKTQTYTFKNELFDWESDWNSTAP